MPYSSLIDKRENQQQWRAANKAKTSEYNRALYLRKKAARLGVDVDALPALRQQEGWTRTGINQRKLHADRTLDAVMGQLCSTDGVKPCPHCDAPTGSAHSSSCPRGVRAWQHDETGRITETAECPGPRWTEVPLGVTRLDGGQIE